MCALRYQQSNLIHRHQLSCMKMSQLWQCNVCKETSDALTQTFSYHCLTCGDFDVCPSCYEPKRHPIHIHELKVVDTSIIYFQTGGNWNCDICKGRSRPSEVLSYHCGACGFNACHDCVKPLSNSLHEHPLYRANPYRVHPEFGGVWQCTHCHKIFGSLSNTHLWHCQLCNYNLCKDCSSSGGGGVAARVETCITDTEMVDSIDLPGPSHVHLNKFTPLSGSGLPGPSHVHRNICPPFSGSGQSHQLVMDQKDQKIMELCRRVVELEKQNHKMKTEYEKESRCIVCLDRKRDVVLVHEGHTGHNCCCYVCALKLDKCPVCRSKIGSLTRYK